MIDLTWLKNPRHTKCGYSGTVTFCFQLWFSAEILPDIGSVANVRIFILQRLIYYIIVRLVTWSDLKTNQIS